MDGRADVRMRGKDQIRGWYKVFPNADPLNRRTGREWKDHRITWVTDRE